MTLHFEKSVQTIKQEKTVIKMTKREHDELVHAYSHYGTEIDEIVMIAIRGKRKGQYVENDVFVPVEVT
jgi:hypothetical protein